MAIEQSVEWGSALASGADDAMRPTSVATQRPRLGQLLVERGLVDEARVDEALLAQRSSGRRLGETLIAQGVISGAELANVLADHLGVPFLDLRAGTPDLTLAALIPENIARRYSALPVARWAEQLVIAMANPSDVFAVDDLRVLIGGPMIAAMAEADCLQELIDRAYRHSAVESSLGDATTDLAPAAEPRLDVEAVDDGPVVRLVDALLEQAAKDKASDLHIEPGLDAVTIRLRIDGVLYDTSEAPLSVLRAMVSRLKVLSGLDIAQTRLPQDGRFSADLQGRSVDIRVATIPTVTGEAMVLRMLDGTRAVVDLPSLGLGPEEIARLEPAVRAAQGGVFVTGPTGSGKTSTLYAALTTISTRDKSIVSVEDPVEYRLAGIRQIQAHPKAGLTFPVALRTILRADPDVIFVGEVRDGETARIAAEAAMTGHLVLSSLHTTRAAAAPVRLIDMGIEPYLVASSLTCVAAQRLVRRLCPECAEPVAEHDALVALAELGAGAELFDTAALRRPVGCRACRNTGYNGRTAIFEIMPVTDGIARLVVEHGSAADIEAFAIEEGMDTLRTAALKRVARGELSVDEMLRVVA